MISLTALPLKTGDPEFSFAWLAIVFLLLGIWLIVKWRGQLPALFSLSQKSRVKECDLERISVFADAKVMRVRYKNKETLIYSDQNGVVQLNFDEAVNVEDSDIKRLNEEVANASDSVKKDNDSVDSEKLNSSCLDNSGQEMNQK